MFLGKVSKAPEAWENHNRGCVRLLSSCLIPCCVAISAKGLLCYRKEAHASRHSGPQRSCTSANVEALLGAACSPGQKLPGRRCNVHLILCGRTSRLLAAAAEAPNAGVADDSTWSHAVTGAACVLFLPKLLVCLPRWCW